MFLFCCKRDIERERERKRDGMLNAHRKKMWNRKKPSWHEIIKSHAHTMFPCILKHSYIMKKRKKKYDDKKKNENKWNCKKTLASINIKRMNAKRRVGEIDWCRRKKKRDENVWHVHILVSYVHDFDCCHRCRCALLWNNLCWLIEKQRVSLKAHKFSVPFFCSFFTLCSQLALREYDLGGGGRRPLNITSKFTRMISLRLFDSFYCCNSNQIQFDLNDFFFFEHQTFLLCQSEKKHAYIARGRFCQRLT